MAKYQRLSGRVAIVTGSGNGIGRGIAMAFASEGARVVVAELKEDDGRAVAEKIEEAGGTAMFIQTDAARESSIQAMVHDTVRRYGTIDVLVNNAGITTFKPLFSATSEDWDKVMNVDLRGVFLCSKYAAAEMVKQSSGTIINISSNHAEATLPDTEIYAAAKAGVNGMTRSMAQSLGPYGITVNAICPGFTDTAHYRRWLSEKRDPLQVGQEVLNLHAGSRICTPGDIAKLAVYLASDDARMMTGETLVMDGGVSTRLYHSDKF